MLPATWEKHPNRNGAMYCTGQGPGALYLDVLTYRIAPGRGAEESLRSSALKSNFDIVTTEGGQEYGRRIRTHIEDGEEVVSHGWLLSFSGAGTFLLAVFSYCIESRYLEDSATGDFLQRLECELLATRAQI